MATVYRARDRKLRRDVAVKVLFPHLCKNREVVARFQREARAAAALDHPHILRVLDVGGEPAESAAGEVDPPYIVLELVRGQSLDRLSGAGGGAPLAEVVAAVGVAIASALAHAHRAGVIHRDIKPGNLLIAEGGRVVLADFGVAHLSDSDSLVTRTGALLGTPAFMSPEQASGAQVDARSDLYSLGATLYQLATGSLPVTGSAARAVAAIAAGDVVPPLRRNRAIGPAMAQIIEQLMKVDPDERPADAEAAEAALRACLAQSGVDDADALCREFFADPAACERRLAPVVVESALREARAAAAAGKTPRALALCDRVLALEPGNVEAVELAARAGSGGWRRKVLVVAAGVAVMAAALVGVGLWVMGGTDREWNDHPRPIAQVDILVDAAPVEVNEEPELEQATGDRRQATGDRRRGDAPRVKPRIASPDPDPDPDPVADPDPDPDPVSDPVAETGTVKVTADAWCELTIDGESRGKVEKGKAREVVLAVGRREIVCAQSMEIGWRETVEVRGGEVKELRAVLLKPITVRVAITRGDRVFINKTEARNGATVKWPPGRLFVKVMKGATEVDHGSVTLTAGVGSCTLVDRPRIACQ